MFYKVLKLRKDFMPNMIINITSWVSWEAKNTKVETCKYQQHTCCLSVQQIRGSPLLEAELTSSSYLNCCWLSFIWRKVTKTKVQITVSLLGCSRIALIENIALDTLENKKSYQNKLWGLPSDSMVKNLPANEDTGLRIPWTEELSGYSPWSCKS